MKKTAFFFALLTLLAFAATAFSQIKSISQEDYDTAFSGAFKKKDERSRRIVHQLKAYKDGSVVVDEAYTYEYLLPDKQHYLHTRNYLGRATKIETITVGSAFYCRKNDGAWMRDRGACSDGAGFGSPSDIIKAKYTLERTDGAKTRVYTSYIIYRKDVPAGQENNTKFYWENKFWLNEEGFVIREESKRGLLEPSRVDYQDSKTYEYDPNIKIEAPIN